MISLQGRSASLSPTIGDSPTPPHPSSRPPPPTDLGWVNRGLHWFSGYWLHNRSNSPFDNDEDSSALHNRGLFGVTDCTMIDCNMSTHRSADLPGSVPMGPIRSPGLLQKGWPFVGRVSSHHERLTKPLCPALTGRPGVPSIHRQSWSAPGQFVSPRCTEYKRIC